MGTIARFDLFDLAGRFGIRHFVETGTGTGESVAHVAAAAYRGIPPAPGCALFRSIRTCEVEMKLVADARIRFRGDPRVHVFADQSETFLRWVCDVLPYDEPILFWLDAHFPGADYGLHGYGETKDRDVRLPLRRELDAIARHRKHGRDVIAIDDLRIYKDGPFAHGNLPADVRPFCPTNRDIDFAHKIMGESHDIAELYEHEGYVLMTPKEFSYG